MVDPVVEVISEDGSIEVVNCGAAGWEGNACKTGDEATEESTFTLQ
jgi:hypothetical protein